MAARPKAICRKAACGALIDAPGYCLKHVQLKTGWNRSHGDQTSAQRGYGYQWQQIRARVLKRDAGLCQIRGKGCTYVAREVDHITNKAKARDLGWTDARIDDESNLQSCCPTCHKAKTMAERGGGG